MLAVSKQFNGVENCKYFHKYIIYNHLLLYQNILCARTLSEIEREKFLEWSMMLRSIVDIAKKRPSSVLLKFLK